MNPHIVNNMDFIVIEYGYFHGFLLRCCVMGFFNPGILQ